MFAPIIVHASRALLTATLVAGLLATPPAHAGEAVARGGAGNPTGTASGSQPNGAGNLKVSLASTGNGKIRVRWKRPAPARKLTKFVVRVGPNRSLGSHVRAYRAGRKAQAITVPRAFGASTTSGNYSFVKVTVHRRSGQRGSSPTKWIQAPLAHRCTAATADRVTVGTFNVRTWLADARTGTTRFNWRTRGDNVVREILRSGAHAVAIQEASGPAHRGFGPKTQDRWILGELNRTDRDRNARWVDALTKDDYRGRGLIGTRVFYDASKFSELASGLERIHDPKAVDSLVPWVRLRAAGGRQAPFVLTSNHLAVGEKRSDAATRGRQVQRLIAIAGSLQRRYGDQVVVAGDLNSTANTKPFNNVQLALLRAGFYDAYATTRIIGGRFSTTNSYHFPVRPTPNRRDYILTAGPASGSCRYANLAYTRAKRVASDHFMQVATLPLPAR